MIVRIYSVETEHRTMQKYNGTFELRVGEKEDGSKFVGGGWFGCSSDMAPEFESCRRDAVRKPVSDKTAIERFLASSMTTLVRATFTR